MQIFICELCGGQFLIGREDQSACPNCLYVAMHRAGDDLTQDRGDDPPYLWDLEPPCPPCE